METKKRKLIWKDGNRTKTARGSGYDIENGVIIFHGDEGDIILTPKTHNGNWMIV